MVDTPRRDRRHVAHPKNPRPGLFSNADKKRLDGLVVGGGGVTSVSPPLTLVGGVADILPATTSTDGSMSAADKAKLDGIPPGGGGGAVTSVADTATVDLTLSAGVLTGAVVNGSIGTTQLSFDPATQAELDAHVNDTVDAHDASAISFVPNGSIAATNVQAAIQEVRDEAAAGGGAVTGVADTTTVDLALAAGTLTANVVAGTGMVADGWGVSLDLPVPVSYGGTGQYDLPSWGVLLGHSSSPITGVRADADDQVLTSLDGSDPYFGQVNLASPNAVKGILPPARMGSGTASATTYLRGDSTWATPAGGGGGTDTHTVATSPPASPVAGDVWLDTTAVAADMVTQAELDAVKAWPKQRLSYGESGYVANATAVAASTYINLGSSQSFTVTSPTSFLDVLVRLGGIIIAGAGAAIEGGIHVFIDGVYRHPIAGFGAPVSGVGGITGGTIIIAGFAAGSHTIQVQLNASAPGTLYIRPPTQPAWEFLSVYVLERNP